MNCVIYVIFYDEIQLPSEHQVMPYFYYFLASLSEPHCSEKCLSTLV